MRINCRKVSEEILGKPSKWWREQSTRSSVESLPLVVLNGTNICEGWQEDSSPCLGAGKWISCSAEVPFKCDFHNCIGQSIAVWCHQGGQGSKIMSRFWNRRKTWACGRWAAISIGCKFSHQKRNVTLVKQLSHYTQTLCPTKELLDLACAGLCWVRMPRGFSGFGVVPGTAIKWVLI